MPFAISQNVNHETNPLDLSGVRTIDNPFPAIVPVKPQTTAELNAANPRVLGHSFENETPYAEQWHLGIERQLFSTRCWWSSPYVGSAGKHLVLCYNPNEVQPGPGSQPSRRLLQPISTVNNMLQCDPRNQSTFNAGTLKVQQRFTNGLQFLVSYTYGKSLDYGGSAASGGGAVATGRRLPTSKRGTDRRGSTRGIARVISYVYELPFGPGRKWLKEGGAARGRGRRLAACRHHDADHRPAVQRVAADRRQQRRAELAEPHRLGQARQADGGSVVQPGATSSRRRANTYGDAGRGILYAPGHVNFDTSLSKRFRLFGRSNVEFRWDAFNLFNHPGFGFPNSAIRQRHRRPDHDDDRRQPQHAVRAEVQLLNRSATARGANAPRAAALEMKPLPAKRLSDREFRLLPLVAAGRLGGCLPASGARCHPE